MIGALRGAGRGGRPMIDMAGQRIGKLLVVERVPKPATRSHSRNTGTWWSCECNCGRFVEFSGERLRSGGTQNCGAASHKADRRAR